MSKYKPHVYKMAASTPDQKLDNIEMILKKHIREQNEHNRRVNFFITEQTATTTKLTSDMDEVKRGVYGDSPNNVDGLIKRQAKTEANVKGLTTWKNRAIWWGSGIVVGVNLAIYLIVHFTNK